VIVFGLAVRGVAVAPPSEGRDGFDPIPLYASREVAQELADAMNERRPRSTVAVIEFELSEAPS
jgi:hypothetical protein